MTNLFEPFSIASIPLRNRIVRSATHEGLADPDGAPTERMRRRYEQLARGGVGAIVTGYAGVMQAGKSPSLHMLMIDRDELVPAHRRLVQAVHALGTPVVLQVAHCGVQTRSAATGEATVSPSGARSRVFRDDRPVTLSEAGIAEVVEAFVRAVERARAAGYDGVQLHAAHGYLLSSFLSPASNRRTDAWGGTTERRARIVTEILRRARARVGDYPVLAKLNGHDGRRGGMRVEEAVAVARLLEEAGCAALEVSCGVYDDGFHTARCRRVPVGGVLAYTHPFRALHPWARAAVAPLLRVALRPPRPLHGYNVAAAARIRAAVRVPVIVVGGLRSRGQMEAVLERGDADVLAMSRPFIREPDVVARLRDGRQEASRCADCGLCALSQELEPLHCHAGRLRRVPAAGRRSAATPSVEEGTP